MALLCLTTSFPLPRRFAAPALVLRVLGLASLFLLGFGFGPVARAEVPPDPGAGLIEKLGVDLSQAKEIVLFTLNTNLGDNIIYDYSRIEYLHEKYPQARIRVIGPTSQILQPQPWLDVVPIEVNRFLERGAAETVVKNPEVISAAIIKGLEGNIRRGSVVIWDEFRFERLAGDISEAVLRELERGGPGVPVDYWTRRGLPRKVLDEVMKARSYVMDQVRQDKARVVSIEYFASNRRIIQVHSGENPVNSSTIRDGEFATVYEESEHIMRQVFGPDARTSWDPALFWNERASGARYRAWKSGAKIKDDSRFIVLNLNTRGRHKLKALERDYATRLQTLLSGLWKQYPGWKIVVTPPEPQFGEAVVAAANEVLDELIQSSGGRVIRFPDDKAIWPALMRNAEFVVSQDSGFVHVANIFNEHVVTLHRERAVQGGFQWRKPGQPAFFMSHARRELPQLAESISTAVQKAGGPAPCRAELPASGLKNLILE